MSLQQGVELQPGDVLLYKPAGVFGRLICLKTWSDYSHVELFVGGAAHPQAVWASRDPKRWFPWPSGGGVNFYPFRDAQLALIRRPVHPLNTEALLDFARSTVGQAYDWTGLLKFFRINDAKQDRMFCSEAATRALRIATGDRLFTNIDADAVSPGMLAWTPELVDVWRAP